MQLCRKALPNRSSFQMASGALQVRPMASKVYLSHEERTANEPRDPNLHNVKVRHISQVHDEVRLLRLSPNELPSRLAFLPGQWLDVHVPDVSKAGGFTVTSTPAELKPANENEYGYLELAIQKAPGNPAAAWLWRPQDEVLGSDLDVRFGGSFTWPPPNINITSIHRIVLVAGGVGINPLKSILVELCRTTNKKIIVLYSTKVTSTPSEILFLQTLASLSASEQVSIQLFLTGRPIAPSKLEFPDDRAEVLLKTAKPRRMSEQDLIEAIAPGRNRDRAHTLVYVCGPPKMTDKVVEFLASQKGMRRSCVLCEKWW